MSTDTGNERKTDDQIHTVLGCGGKVDSWISNNWKPGIYKGLYVLLSIQEKEQSFFFSYFVQQNNENHGRKFQWHEFSSQSFNTDAGGEILK